MNKEYEALIAQFEDPAIQKYLREEAPKLNSFYPTGDLESSFVWSETPQGVEFWAKLCNREDQEDQDYSAEHEVFVLVWNRPWQTSISVYTSALARQRAILDDVESDWANRGDQDAPDDYSELSPGERIDAYFRNNDTDSIILHEQTLRFEK
jgi:hypothetical protein